MQDQIHIVDEQTPTDSSDTTGDDLELDADEIPVRARSLYEQAEPIRSSLVGALDTSFSRRESREVTRFVPAVARELGKGEALDARLVDELDATATDDADLGVLLAFPDESLMFVGSDPTAKDAVPFYAFVVERHQPVPAPESAQDALDLLRPGDVRAAFDEGYEPDRQGEWWLLPTQQVPIGTTFTPGVSSRPYGPSPLGNHVPREWGMTVPDDEFMGGVQDRVDQLPESVTTPPEVIDWVHRQHQKVPTPEFAPSWEEIQDLAGDILVRGTLRHRENDHFVEDVGDTWHTAQTHDMDVYTADDYVERVVLD